MSDYAPIIDRLQLLTEPRDPDHIVYPLQEVLLIVYVSILCNYTEWQSMASFAHYNKDWFRQFYPYRFGFPSQHTIEKVCMLVDPKDFMQLFIDWMRDTVTAINARKVGPPPEKNDNVIAIDGKALRGSRPAKGKKMVHIVSAFSSELNLVLGITPVDKKSNEITAIPEVMDMLMLEGALITMDAMGCQTAICQKIIDKKADYLLCVKQNQPTLHDHIETVFKQHIEEHPEDPEPEECTVFSETVDKNRNRREHRRCWVFYSVKNIIDPNHEWPGLEHCAVIQRDRLIDSRQTTELHFYIMTREMTAESVLASARNHWSTENNQHWQLDVSFGEDASKIQGESFRWTLVLFMPKMRQKCLILLHFRYIKQILLRLTLLKNRLNRTIVTLKLSPCSKIHERTATKNIATVRRCCFNAHKLSNYFEKESMRRRAELAGLDEDYRTKLILEQFG